jgi:hypothetical protein
MNESNPGMDINARQEQFANAFLVTVAAVLASRQRNRRSITIVSIGRLQAACPAGRKSMFR